jgi:hypothetical protein
MSLALAEALGACRPKAPEHIESASIPLDVANAEMLHPLAGLRSLGVVEPQRIMESSLHEALMKVISADHFEAFAASHGDCDLRAARALTVASFDDATEFVTVLGSFSEAGLQRWFRARVEVEGSAMDRGHGHQFEALHRTWGTSRRGREQLGIVQSRFAMWESGRLGPLRVAHLFSQRALRKVRPAAVLEPLATLRALAHKAPIRWFALGPFAGSQAAAVAGLAATCTGLVVAATPLAGTPAHVELKCAMLGTFGNRAAERFLASFNVLANDPLGRLCGLHERLSDVKVQAWDDRIEATLIVDALRIADGLRAATEATVADVMRW